MNVARITINIPQPLKAKLDFLKRQGYTTSGYIRGLLERELGSATKKGG